jgi:hypothetical protein
MLAEFMAQPGRFTVVEAPQIIDPAEVPWEFLVPLIGGSCTIRVSVASLVSDNTLEYIIIGLPASVTAADIDRSFPELPFMYGSLELAKEEQFPHPVQRWPAQDGDGNSVGDGYHFNFPTADNPDAGASMNRYNDVTYWLNQFWGNPNEPTFTDFTQALVIQTS